MTQSNGLDPITVEVVRHKLEGVANEMQQTLLRSSFSPIVKEGLDASSSLFTIRGETLAQATAIPIHLATLIPVVAKFLDVFPLASMKPGDVYCMNDPYLGGTHLPDIALVQPVFFNGRPIALSATMTHHQDVGGMSAGSIPTNATEIFQEGLRLPPLKFRDAGQYNETLVAIIRQNVRIPDAVMGDLNAQLAACNVGARRIAALAAELGENHALAIFDELLDRSEILTRAALRSIPAGTYRYVDFSDNDGIDLDKSIRFEVAVTVKDGTFHCDFAGTSPQVRGPFNCVPSGTLAAACYAVRAVTDPAIPTNAGCFRPITLELPKGSVVNPLEPAPVNSRTATIKRIAGCILGALKEVLPERVPADSAGELVALMFGGRHGNGQAFVTGELIAGGSGAGPALRRRRRHRDRRHQLHEPARGGPRDGCADPRSSPRAPAGLRRRRHAARRPGGRQGIRDPGGRGLVHLSRRTALLRAAGRAGRRRRRQGPCRDQARRRPGGSHSVEDDGDPEARRPGRHRDGGRRRQRPAGRAQPRGAGPRPRRRQR